MTETIDDVRLIGGKPYRTGFLNAAMPFGVYNDDAYFRRMARRENVLFGEKDVYHYTSLAGFQGIIASRGFWASDHRFMNDTEERLDGVRLAAAVLEYCIRRSREKNFLSVVSAVQMRILEPIKHGNFIACFSLARDSLEQWRGYGVSGGLCISLGKAGPDADPLFYLPDQMPRQVVYRPRPKAVMLLSIIRRFEREFQADLDAMPGALPDNHVENYVDFLSESLIFSISAFKNRSFIQENEIRIVIPYSNIKKYKKNLRFRPSAWGLIPYLCTGDRMSEEKKLPIKEIIVGPSSHQSLVAESVRTYLDYSGYQDVNVSKSSVPFRS